MKKLALILISVFTIFGGLFLSSCGKKVSLSVDTQSVVIFTNNDDPGEAGFYQKKTVNVTLENSAGAYLEILSGADSVRLDQKYATHKVDDQYSFTIYGTKSGSAKVRVSAVDDKSQFATIDVTVNTLIEHIVEVQNDNVNNRSNKFAIKENREDAQGTNLKFEEFFRFDPVTANINEIDWTFAENENVENKFLGDANNPMAEIRDGKIFVYDNFVGETIRLKAYFTQNTSISKDVTLNVLEKATISTLTLGDSQGDKVLIGANPDSDRSFALKRNDSDFSNISGHLVLNSVHAVTLEPVFVQKSQNENVVLSESQYSKYFNFNITKVYEPEETEAGKYIYDFTIEALDTENNWLSGDFSFYLRVQYRDFDYAIDTANVPAQISINFTVESVEVSNSEGDIVNDANIDVYSSYADSYGRALHVLLKPENVTLNERYQIKINLSQRALQNFKLDDGKGNFNVDVDEKNISQIVKFFDERGQEIKLERDYGDDYIKSASRANNGIVYVLAGQGIESMLDDLEVEFVSLGLTSKTAKVIFDLYRIGDESEIEVTKNGDPIADEFISSSRTNESRTIKYEGVRIDGFSSLNGLSLVWDNTSRFSFSELSVISFGTGTSTQPSQQKKPYMIVSFTASLIGYNFSASTAFHFEHVTGKRSNDFHVEAFIPLDSASIQNGDKQSSGVFEDQSLVQGYVLNEGMIEIDNEKFATNSLARLTLEAGITLSLDLNYTSLSGEGIEVKYLPLWESFNETKMGFDEQGFYIALKNLIAPEFPELKPEQAMKQLFSDLNYLSFLVKYLNYFVGTSDAPFTFNTTTGKLSLSQNAFKGFVAVLFHGYQFDEVNRQRVPITLVRIFALESMFSVRSLTSSVRETTLYTTETLSIADLSRSYVDVSIALRNDQNIPTYTNDLSYFTFVSEKLSSAEDNGFKTDDETFKVNDYYSISQIRYTSSGRIFAFRITANSTMFQPQFDDIISIYYDFKDDDLTSYICKAEIQIKILNMARVEKVTWTNETEDGEIYFNIKSNNPVERSFTISAAVEPSKANDKTLRYQFDQVYSTVLGQTSKFEVAQYGQTFNLTLNDSVSGGYGYIYLLPEDMIKRVDGIDQILVYQYDENGRFLHTDFVPLYELPQVYDDLVGNGETDDNGGLYCNYFLNNDGVQVFNKDIILKIRVTIADGRSEQTAIRIYTADELKTIQDTSCFYEIMNNLTLENWKTISDLSGGIFGRNSFVTLTFTGKSASFVGRLSGLLRDLTLTGSVSAIGSGFDGKNYAGFVADINDSTGRMKNLFVDVLYSVEDKKYQNSILSVSNEKEFSAVGGAVGINLGEISNVTIGGLSIDASKATFSEENAVVGGLAGQNDGKIMQSSVQFYQFEDGVNKISVPNKVVVGGIVGYASRNSQILQSYAYAYPFEKEIKEQIFENDSAKIGAILGRHEAGARVQECFAFLGEVKNLSCSTEANLNFSNSYVTYAGATTKIVKLYVSNSETVRELSQTRGSEWENATNAIKDLKDENGKYVWATGEQIDGNVNFNYMHLAKTIQDLAVDTGNLTIKDNLTPLQSLGVESGKGILFRYALADQNVVLNSADQSALNRRNTIEVQNLFALNGQDLSEKQARSILVSTTSNSLIVNTNSIQVRNKSLTEIVLQLHTKMNLTSDFQREFRIIILDYLPTLSTTVDKNELLDGQTLLLQKNKKLTILFNLDNAISVNGTMQNMSQDEYFVDYAFKNAENDNFDVKDDEHLIVEKSSKRTLLLSGIQSHLDDEKTEMQAFVQVDDLGLDMIAYTQKLKSLRTREVDVSVFDGATALDIENAKNLNFKVSDVASFGVILATDNSADDLTFTLEYDGKTYELSEENQLKQFKIDDNLWLDVSWNQIELLENGQQRYRVLVKVDDEKKHLVASAYENLMLHVNAKSQQEDENFAKTVNLSVLVQNIEDVAIQIYSISGRSIRNSTTYYQLSSKILNTMIPSSDAIVAVTVTPAFAQMTHFTLTHNAPISMVTFSRLAYDSSFGGYHSVSKNVSTISNGIRVDLSNDDRQGSGIYYFRVYISGSVSVDTDLTFTITFFGQDQVYTCTQNISVDFMRDAEIFVKNIKDKDDDSVLGSTTYLLAKGESAYVTVRIWKDQTLYNLSLEKAGLNISRTDWRGTEKIIGNFKEYSFTLTAFLNARLSDGSECGFFYVTAEVERIINGVQDIKQTRATICLVDFTIDAQNISLLSNGETKQFNGSEYDVLRTYVGAHDDLDFEYPLLPEEYVYDRTNTAEVEAYERLIEERRIFETSHSYENELVGYYINHRRDENTGIYHALSLKQQLYYVNTYFNEEIESPIYNSNYDTILQDDGGFFTINRSSRNGYEGLTITGNKPHSQNGGQLMRLKTSVIFRGVEITYQYDFLIFVDTWTDEETPTQIFSGADFVQYATESELPDDYILMNDIVLDNYTPLSTELIKSLDGNGYTIHLNSFEMPEDGELNLALFSHVVEGTTLKNVRVNVYGAGQLSVDVNSHTTINVAGFVITNDGIIYNCEVVSYFSQYQQSTRSSNGIVVTYTKGNGDPIEMSQSFLQANNIESNVAGFAYENNASIVNCRVGGESFKHIIQLDGRAYLQTIRTDTFAIQGQGGNQAISVDGSQSDTGGVAGFIIKNNGQISACFAKNVQINNKLDSINSITAGFVVSNRNSVQGSYVEGKGASASTSFDLTTIDTKGYVAGFALSNFDTIKNCYSNIAIERDSTPSYSAGFVYINQSNAQISLCFTACTIADNDINQMPFSGVDQETDSLNFGIISNSYFYVDGVDQSNQNKVTSGALPISKTELKETAEEKLYGFSFASDSNSYDGIWTRTENGITLVSANKIAISNRYAQTTGSIVNLFYNRTITDVDTYQIYNLAYGTENNPIIIRDAYDFAVATGKATTKRVNSAYEEFYDEYRQEVFGNYRLVNDVDLEEIDQNLENVDQNSVKLTTITKTFKGVLDGNGFSISKLDINLKLNSNDQELRSFGLFEKLQNAVVMNLNLQVVSVNAKTGHFVGALSGIAIDSRIVAISLEKALEQQKDIRILGNNIVGGVVGALLGRSQMIDVRVDGVKVEASYWDENKKVGDNAQYVDRLLLGVNTGDTAAVMELSYGGAVAGFVDVNNGFFNSTYVIYDSSSLILNKFDLINVKANGSVDVFAEIAGGLFGYIGKTTHVYDASLSLDAPASIDQSESPSYIISENMFAGGLVGESYGAIFGSFVQYEDDLQDSIETSANSYYSNGSGERGQKTIFSYTRLEPNRTQPANNPLYVGGLVGYIGGGYITKSYSKLNVISYSSQTIAVGGLVGLAATVGNRYPLQGVTDTPTVDIYFDEVYASGDVHIENLENAGKTSSAGLVGAIWRDEKGSAQIGLKKAMAVNMRDVDKNLNSIMGDDVVAQNATSKNHFILVGRVYAQQGENCEIVENVAPYPYIINSNGDYVDFGQGSHGAFDTGTYTVGGFDRVIFGQNQILMDYFGFGQLLDLDKNRLVKVQPLGSSSFASMPATYSYLSRFFLGSEWDVEYWEHKQDHAFPNLRLLPGTDVEFWDMDNTDDILARMAKNPYMTIVVRGREKHDEELCADYGDIDLTKPINVTGDVFKTIKDFEGNLISMKEYKDGEWQQAITIEDEEGRGGKISLGDQAGLILDQPLFAKADGVSVRGLNIYLCAKSDDAVIDYSLIQDDVLKDSIVSNADFSKNRVVLNQSVYLKTIYNDDAQEYGAGLFACNSRATSFVETTIETRNGASFTFQHDAEEADCVSMGILSGSDIQNSSVTNLTISGIYFTSELEPQSSKLWVNFVLNGKIDELNLGLYVGRIRKEVPTTKISLGVLPAQQDIEIDVQGIPEAESVVDVDNLYAGGTFGYVNGADNVEFLESEAENPGAVLMFVDSSLKVKNTFAAGLIFGNLDGAFLSVKTSEDTGKAVAMKGGIYQVGDAEFGTANVGGFAGKSVANISIVGLSMDFSVGRVTKDEENNKILPQYHKEDENNNLIVDLFEKSLFDFSSLKLAESDEETTLALSPFVVKGNGDDAIGGLFGFVNGEKIALNGKIDVCGTLDLQLCTTDTLDEMKKTNAVAIGGMIGKFSGELSTNMSTSGINKINISVREDYGQAPIGRANVGGMIGEISSVGPIKINEKNGQFNFTGNVLSSIHELVFGGAIGSMPYKNNTEDDGVIISKVVFGGAVKIYGDKYVDGKYAGTIGKVESSTEGGGKVTVGGVVGKIGEAGDGKDAEYLISNCFSFGDVFVNYLENYSTESKANNASTTKLTEYNFGGIVGSANGISVHNNVSMMTNFNSRVTEGVEGYNIGALVGKNSDIVDFGAMDGNNFTGNYYSSMVAMAYQYQENENNIDRQYKKGSDGNKYFGYSSSTDNNDDDEDDKYALSSARDIFDEVREIGVNYEFFKSSVGEKLNPYPFSSATDQFKSEGEGYCIIDGEAEDESKKTDTLASTHGITWSALVSNVEETRKLALVKNEYGEETFECWYEKYDTSKWPIVGEDVYEDMTIETSKASFSNLAFIGNGRNMNLDIKKEGNDRFIDIEDDSAPYHFDDKYNISGLVDSMGEKDAVKSNFNLVSGLVLNYDNVEYDFEITRSTAVDLKQVINIGGVAGATYGNSFIYGVGVEGSLSVGYKRRSESSNSLSSLSISGIVGQFNNGMINESYSDLNIVARAGEPCGIAAQNYSSDSVLGTIMSTYSAGSIMSYIGGNNLSTVVSTWGRIDLIDVYSYTQVIKRSIDGRDIKAWFNDYNGHDEDGSDSIINIFGQVVNGSYGVGTDWNTASTMAMSYTGEEKHANSLLAGGLSVNNAPVTRTPWYFSPYTNNGYATHGFGYLKNVSTYTRKLINEETVVPEYEYYEVSYEDILKYGEREKLYTGETQSDTNSWFLGVANYGKFKQMVDAVKLEKKEDKWSPNEKYTKDFRFVLENDIDMTIIEQRKADGGMTDGAEKTKGEFNFTSGAGSVGASEKDFIFDGNAHTLDFKTLKLSNSFFDTVNGKIENLRLNEIQVGEIKNGAATSSASGTLAATFSGELSNVTVVGSLNTNAATAGGIVGKLSGNATAVTSLVNVTATSGGVVGGIVGELNFDQLDNIKSTISYSPNVGQIIVTGSTATEIGFGSVSADGRFNAETKIDEKTAHFNAVVGGIVGIAHGGTAVEESYNSNAVLSGYTAKDAAKNYLAGGIVGYADGTNHYSRQSGITISNTYNAGFVGAGNYGTSAEGNTTRSAGYAFAGGIVGYGENVTLSGNINDAGVEALGNMPETLTKDDYAVEIKLLNNGKVEDNNGIDAEGKATGGYTNGIEKLKQGGQTKLDKLQYAVTLTYNLGKSRQVYAYGIGFVNDGEFDNNYTSDNNIKNDGCIGQVKQTKIITFDRQSMYAGVDWDSKTEEAQKALQTGNLKNFWAYFNADAHDAKDNYFVNGFDSYGFPMHIYKTDTMIRTYGRILNDANNGVYVQLEGSKPEGWNEIQKANEEVYYARPGYEWDEIFALSEGDNKFIIVDNDIFNYYKDGVYSNEYTGLSYYYKGIFESSEDNDWKSLSSSLDSHGSENRHWFANYDPTYNDKNSYTSFMGRGENNLITQGGLRSTYYGVPETVLTHEDFLMKQETEYAEGVRFAGYDEILKGEAFYNDTLSDDSVEQGSIVTNTGFGLEAFDASNLEDATADVDTSLGAIKQTGSENSDVNSKIAEINKKVEGEKTLQSVTINGKPTAIVSSGNGFKAAVAPFKYSGEATFAISDFNFNTQLTKSNFSILGCEFWEINGEISKSKENGTITLPFVAWMSSETTSPEFTVTLNYVSNIQEKILGINNVQKDGSNLRIQLKDERGETLSSLLQSVSGETIAEKYEELFKVLNANLGKDEDKKVEGFDLQNLKIGDQELDVSGCQFVYENDNPYITIPFSGEFADLTLSMTFGGYVASTAKVDVEIATSTTGGTFDVQPFARDLTFVGFEQKSLNELDVSTEFEDVTDPDPQTSTHRISLSEIEEKSNGKIALGNETDGYGLNYTTTQGWNLFSTTPQGTKSLSLAMNVGGEEKSVTIEIQDEESGAYLCVSGEEDAVLAFEAAFEKFDVYVNKNNSEAIVAEESALELQKEVSQTPNTGVTVTYDATYNLDEKYYNSMSDPKSDSNGFFVDYRASGGGSGFSRQGFFFGNDFDNVSGDDITSTSVSHFGLDFFQKTVRYHYSLSEQKLKSTGNSYGIELRKDSADGEMVLQAYVLSSKETPLNLPDGAYHLSIVSSQTADGQFANGGFQIKPANQDASYQISKGTDSQTGSPFVGKNYVETTKYGENGKEWAYRVYEDGTFSVEYVYIAKNGSEARVLYYVDNGRVMEAQYNSEEHIWNFGDAKAYAGDDDPFSGKTFEDYEEWNLVYDVDLIVSYVGNQTVLFSRNKFSNNLIKMDIESVEKEESVSVDASMNLTYNMPSEVEMQDVTSLQYREKGGMVWRAASEDENGTFKFEVSEFGKHTFEYRYGMSVSKNVRAESLGKEENSTNFVTIVLDADIQLNTSFAETNIDKDIFGSDKIIKFVGNSDSSTKGIFLNDYAKTLQKVKISAVLNCNSVSPLIVLSGQTAKKASMKDVTFFGDVRNLQNVQGESPLVVSMENDAFASNIKSFMVINSLDGLGDDSAELKDFMTYEKQEDQEIPYVSKNILIAGDGKNGENGFDDDGSKGGDAGSGVGVSVQENFDGFVKLGAKGMAGFGGNAKNNDGKTGGKAGEDKDATAGEITFVDNNGEVIEGKDVQKTLRLITSEIQYSGNSGTKAVSSSVSKETSGDHSHVFADERMTISILENKNWSSVLFGKQGNSTISKLSWLNYNDNNNNQYDEDKWYKKQDIQGISQEISGQIQKYTTDKKVYISIKTGDESNYDEQLEGLYQYRRVVWTSGESVNSGGYDSYERTGKDSNGIPVAKDSEIVDRKDLPTQWDVRDWDTFDPGKKNLNNGNIERHPSIEVVTPWESEIKLTYDEKAEDPNCRWSGQDSSEGTGTGQTVFWDTSADPCEEYKDSGSGNWKYYDENVSVYNGKAQGQWRYYNPNGTDLENALRALMGSDKFESELQNHPWWLWVYKEQTVKIADEESLGTWHLKIDKNFLKEEFMDYYKDVSELELHFVDGEWRLYQYNNVYAPNAPYKYFKAGDKNATWQNNV